MPLTRTAVEAARRKFSPEFMNRLDKIVVFNTLRPEHLEQILELELAKVQQRIAQAAGPTHFTFRCSSGVKQWLLREGTDPRYGARSSEEQNRGRCYRGGFWLEGPFLAWDPPGFDVAERHRMKRHAQHFVFGGVLCIRGL